MKLLDSTKPNSMGDTIDENDDEAGDLDGAGTENGRADVDMNT
jgi:hypothetical protein